LFLATKRHKIHRGICSALAFCSKPFLETSFCERPLPCPPKSQREGLPYDKPSKFERRRGDTKAEDRGRRIEDRGRRIEDRGRRTVYGWVCQRDEMASENLFWKISMSFLLSVG